MWRWEACLPKSSWNLYLRHFAGLSTGLKKIIFTPWDMVVKFGSYMTMIKSTKFFVILCDNHIFMIIQDYHYTYLFPFFLNSELKKKNGMSMESDHSFKLCKNFKSLLISQIILAKNSILNHTKIDLCFDCKHMYF